MPVVILNGNTKAVWCSSIATVQSPTAAELNGGTALETFVRTDGLKVSLDQEKVPSGNLGTKYKWERFGLIGYAVEMGLHHDTVADTAWLLFPFKTAGFLAIRTGLARTTAFATGQGAGGATGALKVLPLECGMTDEMDPPDNWDFTVPFALIGDPAERAVVA